MLAAPALHKFRTYSTLKHEEVEQFFADLERPFLQALEAFGRRIKLGKGWIWNSETKVYIDIFTGYMLCGDSSRILEEAIMRRFGVEEAKYLVLSKINIPHPNYPSRIATPRHVRVHYKTELGLHTADGTIGQIIPARTWLLRCPTEREGDYMRVSGPIQRLGNKRMSHEYIERNFPEFGELIKNIA